MVTLFQNVVIETEDGGCQVVPPGKVKAEITEDGSKPMPASLKDKLYFSVQSRDPEFKNIEQFRNACSRIIEIETKEGRGAGLKDIWIILKNDKRLSVSEIVSTTPPKEEEESESAEFDRIVQRATGKTKVDRKSKRFKRY